LLYFTQNSIKHFVGCLAYLSGTCGTAIGDTHRRHTPVLAGDRLTFSLQTTHDDILKLALLCACHGRLSCTSFTKCTGTRSGVARHQL